MAEKPAASQHHADLALPLPANAFGQFLEGAKTPLRGWQFMSRHPALWRFGILPVAVNLLVTGLVFSVLIAGITTFVIYVHPWFTEGQAGWSWWLWLAGEIALALLMLVVCGTLVIITWKLLTGILCGYFYGKLAERVEQQLGIQPDELRPLGMMQDIVNTLLGLLLLILLSVFFILLNCLPLVGGIVATAGSFYVAWMLVALEYLSYPLGLRGVRRKDRIQFAFRHHPYSLGLGAAVSLFQFIPIVGAVLLTTAVVGTVLLHRRLAPTGTAAAEANVAAGA